MVKKYVFGTPFETEAVICDMEVCKDNPQIGSISVQDGFRFEYKINDMDVIYGLGEANRGINKRGYIYVSDCSDDPEHTEGKISLYGAHNFIIISGKENVGLFFDYPSKLTFLPTPSSLS